MWWLDGTQCSGLLIPTVFPCGFMEHLVTNFRLNTGDEIPAVGLGTWKIAPEDADVAVSAALEAGYRHFDCAPKYNNEPEIGRALEDGMARMGIDRKDLFITSKLWPTEFSPPDVLPALQRTLQDLRLSYLDLFLLHIPVQMAKPWHSPPQREDRVLTWQVAATWQQMEAAVEQGLVRAIGVSNWSVTRLKQLLSWRPVHVPAVNQVEAHPHWRQDALLAFCKEKGIHVSVSGGTRLHTEISVMPALPSCFHQAYAPLGSRDRPVFDESLMPPVLLDHPLIKEVANTLHQTPAQVALRWGIQRGMSVLPKSSNPWHIKENIGLFDWCIPPMDFHALSLIEPQVRILDYYGYWVGEGRPFLEPEELWNDEADKAGEGHKVDEGDEIAFNKKGGGRNGNDEWEE
ncbi:unnamed protein product [Closterium sp. Yama58-4]|nr:unnamed protein product [Closterium sp. Yama58-4]